MLTIETVTPAGPAARCGIRPGDRITAVNGRPVQDIFDYLFYADGTSLRLTLRRGTRQRQVIIREREAAQPELEFEPFTYRRCNNRCIFCFVDQLPPGARQALRFKDEDYRLSFLHGNYITATNLRPDDMARIIRLRLSPLYISVHATDESIRRRMLGNPPGRVQS